jgi:hypothetical protein
VFISRSASPTLMTSKKNSASTTKPDSARMFSFKGAGYRKDSTEHVGEESPRARSETKSRRQTPQASGQTRREARLTPLAAGEFDRFVLAPNRPRSRRSRSRLRHRRERSIIRCAASEYRDPRTVIGKATLSMSRRSQLGKLDGGRCDVTFASCGRLRPCKSRTGSYRPSHCAPSSRNS